MVSIRVSFCSLWCLSVSEKSTNLLFLSDTVEVGERHFAPNRSKSTVRKFHTQSLCKTFVNRLRLPMCEWFIGPYREAWIHSDQRRKQSLSGYCSLHRPGSKHNTNYCLIYLWLSSERCCAYSAFTVHPLRQRRVSVHNHPTWLQESGKNAILTLENISHRFCRLWRRAPWDLIFCLTDL